MAEKKEKIVSFRRAEWLIEHPDSATLASLLRQAARKLKSASERTVNRGGQEMVLASLKPDQDGGLYLHITADTPGESASVVPKARKATDEIKVGTTAPPTDSEFMDGDAFVYIRDNDVCLCTTGIHDGAIRRFLQLFFKAANLRHDADQFELMKVADVSRLKLLQTQGVKEIELRSTISEATTHYNRRKAQTLGIPGSVAKHIKAIFGSEHDVNQDAMRVEITLKTDRRRKGLKLGEKRIQALATDILKNQEDEDEYVIVTKSGQRIGPKEIFVKSQVRIDSIGKSVQRDKAWKELIDFYNGLKSSGILEE